jgi:hypothetical protein
MLCTGCRGCNTVNADAATPAAQRFWQLLQANDVAKAMDMYEGSIWHGNMEQHSLWSGFLTGLAGKFGPVASFELRAQKWFPGDSLVIDHRAFVCYAYDYEVKRQTLASQERLIICGEPRSSASEMRIYGHDVVREDTHQSVRVGIDYQEKNL